MVESILEEIILPGTAKLFDLRSDYEVEICSRDGGQIANMTFKYFNQALTRHNDAKRLNKNMVFNADIDTIFYNSKGYPLVKIKSNNTGGAHSLMHALCREEDYGYEKKGCNELLRDALKIKQVPSGVSLFSTFNEETHKKNTNYGDNESLILECILPVKIGICACPYNESSEIVVQVRK